MHDAHFHMTEELFTSLKAHGMQGIANAESIKEYRMLAELQQEYSFFISAGVHPWHASLESFREMEELMKSSCVSLIGEIGLDNVWCETPMKVQREVFDAQLQLASRIRKPVVLHTKGMEKEIAERIRRYPNTYLVHWYSSMENLEDYLALNCYFTIGPSVGLDPAVTRVAEMVPLDRMLIETDGVDAVRWVQEAYPDVCFLKNTGKTTDSSDRCYQQGTTTGSSEGIGARVAPSMHQGFETKSSEETKGSRGDATPPLHHGALSRSICELAKIRRMKPREMEQILSNNWNRFVRQV